MPFRDLVSHPVDHAANALGVEDLGLLLQALGHGKVRASLWVGSPPVKVRPGQKGPVACAETAVK
jgi:hypothetical protein